MLISSFPNYNAEERIIELENKFNIALPTQYRKFLCKYNGGDTPETRYKAGRNSSDPRAFYGFIFVWIVKFQSCIEIESNRRFEFSLELYWRLNYENNCNYR